jgi:hypothetical protein
MGPGSAAWLQALALRSSSGVNRCSPAFIVSIKSLFSLQLHNNHALTWMLDKIFVNALASLSMWASDVSLPVHCSVQYY